MYASYGSYSSMSTVSQPIDIAPTSYSSAYTASCAFPSWPKRSSLRSEHEPRSSSYLSDDELFPQDMEDDVHSISSASSNASCSPNRTQEEIMELQREKAHMQREALRFLLVEKEKRRQAYKKQRRGSSGSSKKDSPKQADIMTPISEAVE